jgi:HAD superfamily hydrolase (TIGR01549 family)
VLFNHRSLLGHGDSSGCEDARVATEAVLFDLDDTLLRRTAPSDWDMITALQVAEITPHCDRLGFGHLDLTNVVRRFWATFDKLYPDDRFPNPPIAEPRWREGPAAFRNTLAEYAVACSDYDAVCLWEVLHNVPDTAKNHHLYPDAVTTIVALSTAGYRLAVATARPESAAVVSRNLRLQGMPDVFDVIATSGEVGFRKPHPLVFESAIRQLDVWPERAIVVGDSYDYDIVPAASLGMVPVLKLNERAPDPNWVLARHQVPTLAALLELDILRRECMT